MLGEHLISPILLSRDLDRSSAFYHGLLGLAVLHRDDERLILQCGHGSQLVLSRSTTGTADTQTQVAWRVPDLRAELADLRARGVTAQQYRAPEPVTDADGVADMDYAWAAWILDPDGNALGIIQPKVPSGEARPQ